MDEQRFDMYRRYMPDMKMDYVYYYDTTDDEDLLKRNPGLSLEALARKRAFVEGMDFLKILSPAQIKKRVDLSPEKYHLVRQLQYGERSTFLRFYDDMMQYASEEEITAALERLVDPMGVPRIGFLTGNEERSNFKAGDADYKTVTNELGFRHSLINQGFDVDTVSFSGAGPGAASASDSASGGGVPGSWTALVIADPKIAFTPAELAEVRRGIEAGRNLLITGEPGRQEVLNPLLRELGISLATGRLVGRSADFGPDFVLAGVGSGADGLGSAGGSVGGGPGFKALRQAGAVISMPGVAALHHDSLFGMGFTARPVLVRDTATVALALTRKIGEREQRIMVVGDADFMSTAEMSRHAPRTGNFDFITDVFSWLNDGRYPVDTGRPKTGDVLNMGRDAVLLVRVVFFGALPLLLILGGTILLVSRKRR